MTEFIKIDMTNTAPLTDLTQPGSARGEVRTLDGQPSVKVVWDGESWQELISHGCGCGNCACS